MSKVDSSSLTAVSPPDGDGVFIFSPVPGVLFSEYGMQITPGLDLSFDVWQLAGESLATLQRRSYMIFMWGWGDWLNAGKQKYGEKYTQGMEITGLRYRTLTNYTYVAAATPRYLRGIKGLSQRHYLVVAKIKDPLRKLQLLMDAAINGWTASVELPRQIAISEQPEVSPPDEDSSDVPPPPTLEDVVYQLQQEKYSLEGSVLTLSTHNAYLEDVIRRSILAIGEIAEQILDDSLKRKMRVILAILEAEPRRDVFENIVAAIARYKQGDMTALVTYMDQIVLLMED